jgi:uncharacterized membrane protein
MELQFAAIPAAAALLLTGTLLLVSRDWRFSVFVLALQYFGVFVLIALSWPFELAVIKLVTGWISGAILGLALVNTREEVQEEEVLTLSGSIFRVLLAVLALLIAYSVGLRLVVWLPELELEQAIGGMALILVGLIHLGLTSLPLRVVLGLLTVMSGFEILYAGIERSALVIGLLAFVSLGLAFTGAYMLVVSTLEEAE